MWQINGDFFLRQETLKTAELIALVISLLLLIWVISISGSSVNPTKCLLIIKIPNAQCTNNRNWRLHLQVGKSEPWKVIVSVVYSGSGRSSLFRKNFWEYTRTAWKCTQPDQTTQHQRASTTPKQWQDLSVENCAKFECFSPSERWTAVLKSAYWSQSLDSRNQ